MIYISFERYNQVEYLFDIKAENIGHIIQLFLANNCAEIFGERADKDRMQA